MAYMLVQFSTVELNHVPNHAHAFHSLGAVLDRNGLRPARILQTNDGRVLLCSELGLLPIDPAAIVKKARLKPGKLFLIDFSQQRIISDKEFKLSISTAKPYAQWLANQQVRKILVCHLHNREKEDGGSGDSLLA